MIKTMLNGGAEAVKKLARCRFPSFRRKPESSNLRKLRTAWTPVFTGVTAKMGLFHSFAPACGSLEC